MSAPPSLFARYQAIRRPAEIGYWVVVLLVEAAFNSAVTLIDRQRMGPPVATWEPWLWELSSAAALGLLVPAVVAFERRFPLRWRTLRRHLPWHLGASVVFCAAHVGLMMALRLAGYALLGRHYGIDDWWTQGVYEYLKDVRTYASILAAVLTYRFLMLRLQGEASVLDAPEPPPPGAPPDPPPQPPPRPERFLVRKLKREFLIAAGDIAWLQAQGNYVGLHVNGHDYLLRSTLADFLAQLDPARFVRVHRSHAVNLDQVAEIEPLDSGDARLRMRDGSTVPCSRRYRAALASPGAVPSADAASA